MGQALLAGALVGSGALAGWAVASERSEVEAGSTAPASSDLDRPADDGAEVMPDLRGLGEADSRQILADLGVPAGKVTVQAQPAAGEAGIVVAQEPPFGGEVGDGVVLRTSEPARVPAFQGRDAEAVLGELDELGAEVETVSQYAPGTPPGQVVSIDPRPGTALPSAVTVVISAEPGVVALADLSTVDGSCYTADDTMNGQSTEPLLSCESDAAAQTDTWVVRRAAGRLTGLIGVPDSSTDAPAMQLDVIGDGRVLATYQVAYGGTPQRVDVDMTGVLRLALRYRSLSEDYGTVGLGELRLIGEPTTLAQLETS